MSGNRSRRSRSRSAASPAAALALACVLMPILLDSAVAQRVDCRKFVFAPSCRGVAAKRNTVEAAPRKDSEGTGSLNNFLALPEYAAAERGSPAEEEEEFQEEGRVEEEEEEREVEEDEEEAEDRGEEGKGREAPGRPSGGGGRGGLHGWSGPRRRGQRRQERFRKLDPILNLKPGNRKVAKMPATYEWFSSNDRRRQRDKGMGRRSEYINYDY